MAEGARIATGVLGKPVRLWEVQRVLEGRKRIAGLEIIRADEPLPRKAKAKKRVRTYTAEARRKLSEGGRKGGRAKKRPKDITKALLGQAKVGEKNPRKKLTEEQVLDIQIALEEGEKQFGLALQYGVSESLISRIKNGKRWAYLKDDAPEWGVM